MTTEQIESLLEQIEDERAHLRLVLEQVPDSMVAARAANGAWSVLENVRHLLFAEQLHLQRPFTRTVEWSPLGYDPESMRVTRKLPPVTDTPSLASVLVAWDQVHTDTIACLATSNPDAVEHALTRNLKHMRAHIRVMERLARNASK